MTDQPNRQATLTACLAGIMARVEKTFPATEEWERQQRLEAHVAERRLRLHTLQRLEPPIDAASFAGIVHGKLGPSEAVTIVNEWHTGEREPDQKPTALLVLHGAGGSGKTVAAAALAASRATSSWVSACDLIAPYSALFGEDSDDWTRYRSAPLLVIDRLERLSNDKRQATLMEALAVIVDQRKRRRRTIITTRMSLTMLEATVELEPLADLLSAATHYTVTRMPGRPPASPPPVPAAARNGKSKRHA
jgi:hypothetical protein